MTRRLLLSYLTVTLVVLVLLQVPLGIFYAQRERERMLANLEHDASIIATLYEDALEGSRLADPRAADEYRVRTGARVVVVDNAGISVVDTDQVVDRDFSTRPEMADALRGAVATGTRSSETLGGDIMYVAVPVASGGTVHGALRVTLDTSDVTARIQRFWLALAAVAVVVLVAVAIVGWTLAQSVTRPLRRLDETASRFARGDLTPSDGPTRGPPEVQRLGDTMENMARHLDELVRSQRTFVADASHQLRTPLTALRLQLENLQRDLRGESAEALEAVVAETERLTSLVNTLLQLARADDAGARAVVDVTRLASDRVDTWTAVAEAASVHLLSRVPDTPTFVDAVPGGIEQILDNLIDNAMNVVPRGGSVTVSVRPSADTVDLIVEDDGPGLSDADKVSALQRFWRGQPGTPGSGLGLPIAASLTKRCGGELSLEDAPDGGLLVRAKLRAQPEHPTE